MKLMFAERTIMAKYKGKKAGKIALVLMVAAMLFLLSACTGKEKEAPTVFKEGATFQGQDLEGKTAEETIGFIKSYIDSEVSKIKISVKFGEETLDLQKEDFECKEMLDVTVKKMIAESFKGDIPVSYVLDLSETGRKKVVASSNGSYIAPQDATVSGFEGEEFQFSEEIIGRRANTAKVLENVENLVKQKKSGDLQCEFEELLPKVKKEDLDGKFGLMGTASTVSTNSYNGNHNMEKALSLANGTRLEPGEIFSYNATTGDSSNPANGYLPAGAISGGVIVQAYGGGVCQGSTTIYNAVLMAGLEIVERDCHAIESSYVPTGLDAMVSYGAYDFKFKNNTPYPVYMKSWMDGATLYVSFYGVKSEEWDKIELESYRVETYPAPSSVSFTQDSNLAKGEYRLASSGRIGVLSAAKRHFYKDGTLVKTEDLTDSYYAPKGRVYTYGPGTDTSKIDTSKSSGNVFDAERKAQEEQAQREREDAERKAQEEQAQREREEAERRAQEEQAQREQEAAANAQNEGEVQA